MEDIKAKVEELVKKLQADKNLQAQFKENPVKAVESLLGVDLPDEAIQNIVAGVKAKLNLDALGDQLGALGNLFGKK